MVRWTSGGLGDGVSENWAIVGVAGVCVYMVVQWAVNTFPFPWGKDDEKKDDDE
jgi:hypothetical protein